MALPLTFARYEVFLVVTIQSLSVRYISLVYVPACVHVDVLMHLCTIAYTGNAYKL